MTYFLCVFHEQTTHIHNCDTVSKSGNDKVLESLNLGININALNAVMLSLRLVRNPSEKERFPTSGNDKNVKTINAFVLIS